MKFFVAVLWGVLPLSLSANETAPVDLLQDRLEQIQEDQRDVDIQSSALEDFLTSADERIAAMQATVPELEEMRAKLADINKKNLIKVILQLAFETYSTIDSTTGLAKTAVESTANFGIRYAVGRIAFEQGGEQARKAMGLDESNYYGPRTVSIRRVTEESFTQAAEIQKVFWALDKDIAYYRSLKLKETGKDPGQRGAIFYKNDVVRERIGEGITAIQEMISRTRAEITTAENDLEWLRGEAASLASLREGVAMQLQEALVAEREEAISEEIDSMLEEVQPPVSPAGFNFRNQGEDESDDAYYTARYNAGKNRIKEILDPVVPALDAEWITYEEAMQTAEESFDEWMEKWYWLVVLWMEKATLSPDEFGGLLDTLYDWRQAEVDGPRLEEAMAQLENIRDTLAPISSVFTGFNNRKRVLSGIEEIATATAYKNWYDKNDYTTETGAHMGWAGGWSGLAAAYLFRPYYERMEDFEGWIEAIGEAETNAANAASKFRSHYQGLQPAIASVTADERSLVDALQNATLGMATHLGAAETLAAVEPYCPHNDNLMYHGIHNHWFSIAGLSSAIEDALAANLQTAPARRLWEQYLAFVERYEEIDRSYQLATGQGMAAHNRISGNPPMFLEEVRAAHAAAVDIGYPVPSLGLASMEQLRSDWFQERAFVGQVIAHEESRHLPEARVAEDLDVTAPPEMEAPWLNHPLAQAFPAFGLLLLKEEMERQWSELMNMTVRDEEAMWDTVYGLSALIDDWKAAQTDGLLGGQLFDTANKMANNQQYERRQLWEEAFGPPLVEGVAESVAVEPGGSAQLWVSASSNFSMSFAWYRRSHFGPDEMVGNGSRLAVTAPSGLETYYCEVSNLHGTVYSGSIDVYPAVAPQVAFHPQSMVVPAGCATRLEASFYLTTPAIVETSAAWYVSTGNDVAGPYRKIEDSTSNILQIDALVAPRHYYYEVSNPWGTTRTDAASLTLEGGADGPVLVPPPDDLMAYSGIFFSYPFSGARQEGFAWEPLTDTGGLTFVPETGLLAGIPEANPGNIIRFRVRAEGNGRVSPWNEIEIPVMPPSQYPGEPREWYFSPEQLADPEISGPEADPDGDGRCNLLELAFGGDPNVRMEGEEAQLPRLRMDAGAPALEFVRPSVPEGFYYVVEGTEDLVDWQVLPSLGDNPVRGENGLQRFRYEVPEGSGSYQLLRVRVVPVTP
ncbi:MAG: hypothetical protein GVY10_05315 [Verrucomicrobia bacterium]|jgi:hypothetical protein|nr:hypothetical protein [Verrucomicrobiota bacterium]